MTIRIIGYMTHGQIEILKSLPSSVAKVSGKKTDRYCIPVYADCGKEERDAKPPIQPR